MAGPEKIPARDIIIQISDGESSPTWVQINQLTTATHKPGENEESADTTTFDSQGEYEQVIMQRGATLELEGFLRKDSEDGELDAGQLRCEELGSAKGMASVGTIRFRHPMDTNWNIWQCTASLGDQGGATNDMSTWSCTFTRSGPKTTAPVTP